MPYEELIRGIKEGNQNSKNELYEKVKGLIYKEINSFYNRNKFYLIKCGYMDYEDLVQMGNLVFTKTIYKYKLNKEICFSTYLVQAIRNELNMYFFPNKGLSKDYKTNADNLLLDNNLVTTDDPESNFNNLTLKLAMEKLDKDERKLIHERFCEGYSVAELSEKYNVSRVTIRTRIKKTLNKMKGYMVE